ncbi:MAG TPA: hypothetical protein VGK55_15020 [Actinomycetes bacterium]
MGDSTDPTPAEPDNESAPEDPSPGPQPIREPGWAQHQPPPWSSPAGWTTPTAGSTPGGHQVESGVAPERGQLPPPGPAGPTGWTGQQGWGAPTWRREVKPGVIPLRPLGVGEILDGAISAIRRHPKVMLGISAMVGVLAAVLSGLSNWFTLRSSADVSGQDELDAAGIAALGITGAGVLITSLATLMATGMLTVVLGRAVLGQDISVGDAWRQARQFIWRLIGLWLLTGLIVAALAAGGILVAVLLGVLLGDAGIFLGVLVAIAGVIFAAYFYVKLWLAAPALVLEKQPIVQSLRRSSRLVKGSWWRVFGILVLTAILAVVIGQVLQTPFSLLSYGGSVLDPNAVIEPTFLEVAGGSIGVLLAQTVTLPFQAGVTVLLYIDQRMRKEGLDIELTRATSSAGAQPPPP